MNTFCNENNFESDECYARSNKIKSDYIQLKNGFLAKIHKSFDKSLQEILENLKTVLIFLLIFILVFFFIKFFSENKTKMSFLNCKNSKTKQNY